MKTYIVISKAGTYYRETLESIENLIFKSTDDVLKRLGELAPFVTETPQIIPLYEFVTDWNDTDDSEEFPSIKETFITYVNIEK